MPEEIPAYGLWLMVLVNSAIFILFAFSFVRPRTRRNWRSFGAFPAFLVFMHVRLARREEAEALAAFGDEYARYAKSVPAFIPRPITSFQEIAP